MAMALPSSGIADDEESGEYKPLAEINVTPFVDVMLVLLIVFMVAAPLMVQGVPVDLPKTSATKLEKVRKPMVVTLAPDGAIYIRDEQVDRGSLVNRLISLRSTGRRHGRLCPRRPQDPLWRRDGTPGPRRRNRLSACLAVVATVTRGESRPVILPSD